MNLVKLCEVIAKKLSGLIWFCFYLVGIVILTFMKNDMYRDLLRQVED